jgi:hypothetical protein
MRESIHMNGRRALNDPDCDRLHLYLPIAGQLRVLLLDANLPILLVYAQDRGIPLRICSLRGRCMARPRVNLLRSVQRREGRVE